MENQELEPVEIQGKLESTGTFLVDKKAMEKMVDEELFKIANEALLPYKVYLRYSLKKIAPPFLGFLAGIGGIISGIIFCSSFEARSLVCILSGFNSGFWFVFICLNSDEHGLIFRPLRKLYLAKKIFGQVIKELHYEVIDNQMDPKLLKEKFICKVQEITNRKRIAKETQKREKDEAEKKLQKLLSQAKYGLV